MNRTTRIRITELNPHVICVLCGGYFINATTITECLHSFCRTCITRYLQTSKYCPVCDVMVHKTKPLHYIRSDKTLQDLVYKLVPGLYKNEMKRRRDYYAEVDSPGLVRPPSEDRGDEFHDRIIYTEDEKISLSLELCARGVPFKTPTNVHGHTGPDNIRTKDVRYLQCPAAFSVGNLKKFIRMKFDLKRKYEMDIFHTAEPLPDYYTLMDIAYIYTWTRRTPLRLFYTVFERPGGPPANNSTISSTRGNAVPSPSKTKTTIPKSNIHEVPNTHTAFDFDRKKIVLTQKRKYPEGPDDISPDFTLDIERPAKKKRGPKPKKKVKKLLDLGEEESVKEAMSESEEQLAKLTLDCSDDGRRVKARNDEINAETVGGVDTDIGSSAVCKLNPVIGCVANAVNTNVVLGSMVNEELNVRTECNNDDSGVESETGCSRNTAGDSVFDQDSANDSLAGKLCNGVNPTAGLTVVTCSENSKAPSNQTSPGSIHLTLFQPLNVTGVNKEQGDSDNKRNHLEDTEHKETVVKKGRPKGSKNKKKVDTDAVDAQSNGAKTNEECMITNKGKKKRVEKSEKGKRDTTNMCSKIPNSKSEKNEGGTEKVKRKYVRKQTPMLSSESTTSSTEVDSKSVEEQSAMVKSTSETENSNIEEPTIKCTEVNNPALTTNLPQTLPHLVKPMTETDSSEVEKNSVDEIIDNTTAGVQTQLLADENTVVSETNALVEPVTPLYGETPKVSESNQGLPCSPNIKPMVESDKVGVEQNKTEKNHIPKSIEAKEDSIFPKNQINGNGALVGNGPITNTVQSASGPMFLAYPSIQNTMVGYCRAPFYQSAVRLGNPTSIFAFGNVASVACPVSSPPAYFGGFPQPQIQHVNAHAHSNHVVNQTNDYTQQQSCDQHSDQPLDLTNGFNKDEYTKGKIFKTKMLKKSCPKTDSITLPNDKPQNGVNCSQK